MKLLKGMLLLFFAATAGLGAHAASLRGAEVVKTISQISQKLPEKIDPLKKAEEGIDEGIDDTLMNIGGPLGIPIGTFLSGRRLLFPPPPPPLTFLSGRLLRDVTEQPTRERLLMDCDSDPFIQQMCNESRKAQESNEREAKKACKAKHKDWTAHNCGYKVCHCCGRWEQKSNRGLNLKGNNGICHGDLYNPQ